ncbi:MAG: exo-alpha-sialidase [Phycisphaerales bacterium]|nr:MAG: exo-alpha-sialidase [Phycisphaerales bacterium]
MMSVPQVTRRRLLKAAGAVALGGWPRCAVAADRGEPEQRVRVKAIERSILWNGRGGGTTWFHPRACMIPAERGPVAFMTLQSITGSDVFGPVHWSTSTDLGRTWTDPKRIAALGRHPARHDLTEGVCDVVPEYHARTDTVLAIGHNVYYDRTGRLARPQLERYPVYVVRTPDGHFSGASRLQWDDPRGTAIYTCGCAQRVTLPDGRILVPLSFAPKGQTARSVGSVLCAYDGRALTVERRGNELSNGVKRGLLEPTLAAFQGKYYMTIRAEDGHGYVASSTDGLNWETQRPWSWDDGTPLTMSTTQQRWLPHSDALYLIYTRKAEENINVMRWRAPLYLARVDTEKLCLIRASERIVLPLIGDGVNNARHVARMGNFHTVAATADESWVTVGECLPDDDWRGDVLLARIRWSQPNRIHR